MDLRESVVPTLKEPVDLRELYAPRPVEFVDVWEHEGWRLKVYGIPYGRSHVRAELVEAARKAFGGELPSIDERGSTGAGFIVIHDAEDGCYVLVSRWANAIEVHQRILFADIDEPGMLRPLETDVIGCMYELGVIEFERRRWMEVVRENPDDVDLARYFASRMSGAI